MHTNIACNEYISICKAAIQLQACWRGLSVFKQFEQLRREAAAVKIQKDFRCGIRLTTVATKHIPTTRVIRRLLCILNVVTGEEWLGESYGHLKWLQGRVKEAKDKLERCVGELAWHCSWRSYYGIAVGEAHKM
ncbi:unconventional myosin [Artemisia annua]|uniref:Unconventional myosin n=1 Tax=Artemisia annua TaxID=35608 RepID=A0A2U1QIE5_ARTAN|nr:unconventional myosin [Artemisia annua]